MGKPRHKRKRIGGGTKRFDRESRKAKTQRETAQRSSVQSEIRAEGDAGIIEGYVAKWADVDSYNSQFQRGAFVDAIEAREGKIKLLWNHNDDEVIGRVVEIREDDEGLFFRAEMNLEVQRAREVYSLIKNGDIDAMSFAFSGAKSHNAGGVRIITKVATFFECSPVTFPANENSEITGVRGVDFNETLDDMTMREKGWEMFHSIMITIDDIWWSGGDDALNLIDKALEDFHAAYLEWSRAMIDAGKRSATNPISERVNELCNGDIESLARDTSLTIDEARSLKAGECLPVESRGKLDAIDETLSTLHNEQRTEKIATLITEVRSGGLSTATKNRLVTLLQSEPVAEDTTMNELRKAFGTLSKTITGKE